MRALQRARQQNQAGFAPVVIIVVLALIVGAIAYIGYSLYGKEDVVGGDSTSQATTADRALDASDAPEVKSSGDLNAAESTLDQVDPNAEGSDDAGQLDSQLNAIQ